MCVLCDGGSEEDLLKDEFMRIAMNGFVMVRVESEAPWLYTIGLVQSFGHPELVLTGLCDERAAHVVHQVAERVADGVEFTTATPPVELCDCSTVTFGSVHPAQWDHGRFDQWLRYYRWAGGDLPPPRALQVLWADDDGLFPPNASRCPIHGWSCQPLLDTAPAHDVHDRANRATRRHDTRERRRRGGHG